MGLVQKEYADILKGPAWEVAPRLLGARLVREIDGRRLVGRIVETEAYDQSDAASHSYRGRTPRTAVMFGPPGRAYIYFTYGMHYCLNVVTAAQGSGSAVLLRALEPLEGTEEMRRLRPTGDDRSLTNGPAKLCQAYSLDTGFNGHDLTRPPLRLMIGPAVPQEDIVQTTRIGISLAKDQPWRFYLRGNPYVSKP